MDPRGIDIVADPKRFNVGGSVSDGVNVGKNNGVLDTV